MGGIKKLTEIPVPDPQEPQLKVGESYTGDEIMELLGGEIEDRLYAIGNNEKIVVAQDEGNDNYEVLAILDMPNLYKKGCE